MRSQLFVLCVLATLTAACAPAASVDIEAEQAALMERDKAWSETVGKTEEFLAFFAEDGSVSPPGAPRATGREALEETFTQLGSLPNFSLNWQATHAVVSTSGDLGHTVGTYTLGFDGPDGTHMKETGKYVTVWQKQADGSWKVIEDIFNNDAAAAPAEE